MKRKTDSWPNRGTKKTNSQGGKKKQNKGYLQYGPIGLTNK